jgi:hypothetical protein
MAAELARPRRVKRTGTRSGDTRWALVDDARNERSLPPADRRAGRAAEGPLKGRRARISFHEDSATAISSGRPGRRSRTGAPFGRRGSRRRDGMDDRRGGRTVAARDYRAGEKIPPDELYKQLEPFKRRVAEDIRGETTEGPAGVDLGMAVSCDRRASSRLESTPLRTDGGCHAEADLSVMLRDERPGGGVSASEGSGAGAVARATEARPGDERGGRSAAAREAASFDWHGPARPSAGALVRSMNARKTRGP